MELRAGSSPHSLYTHARLLTYFAAGSSRALEPLPEVKDLAVGPWQDQRDANRHQRWRPICSHLPIRH